MMENELKVTSLDDEFFTVEIELKSTVTDKELKCTGVEEELKCTTLEEELKCTTMEEELKCTAVKKKLKFSCQICDKTFTNSGARNYHMRQFHHVEPTDIKKNSIICPLSHCRETFFRFVTLQDHVVHTHKIDLEAEENTFRSYEDFILWKENMEKETKSHYVKRQSPRYANKEKRVLKEFFACHRSGFYTPNRTGNRKMRRIGSKKIGAFCPSSLEVSLSTINTYVKVVHWKKHLGHKCDMNYLPLTESEKIEIADKIKKGMTFSEIIKSYRDVSSGSELHRINFLSRRDLSNIVDQFKIRRNVIASDDYLVNLWVKNMEGLGNDSPVAFFKKQGMENEHLNLEDFMIVVMTRYQKEMSIKYCGQNICIISINGIRSHDFSLTTLLKIDEYSTVFPLAFCISNKTDEVSMMMFFESVKRLVGIIETPVFLSNDDPLFYDAWEKTMAPTSFQLLCKWHVDSCWRKDLDKIGDKDKQASVYKTLRMLLEERDVFKFESSITNFVAELEGDASTMKFAEHFCKNYLPRVKMWAFCYMRHLGISTVEHLEAMHTSLKHLFLDGSQDDNVYNRQVNLAIPALLKLSRDQLLSRLDEFLECLPVDWIDRIQKSHRQSLSVRKVAALNNNSWSVKLFKRADGGHVVTANEASSKEVCYLQCLKCNICIHSFYCTCSDNLINLNICGHMHACAKFVPGSKCIKVLSVVSSPLNRTTFNKFEEVNTGENEMVDTVVDNEKIETLVKHVIPSGGKILLTKQLETLTTMMEYTDFSEQHASQLKNSFDAIISFMIMHGKSRKQFIQVPYKPTNNYLTTVKKKPENRCQNQIITTGQPICVYTVNNIKPS